MIIGKGLQSLIPPKKSKFKNSFSILQKEKLVENQEYLDRENKVNNILFIKTGEISKNPLQPRKNFSKTKLQGLADSIKEHGILQPLIVIKLEDGKYQLIAGERRLEAAKLAGLAEVPAIIRESSEQEKLELALVENLQRNNLNSIEKAYAFKALIDKFNFIQQDIAKKTGKSRESIANTLRLLKLPAEIQRAILENKITEGHGRTILSLPNAEKRLQILEKIIKNKLSVHQTEAIIKKILAKLPRKYKIKSRKDVYSKDLEDKLSETLGTRVGLTRRGEKGKIIIEFFSQEELDNIVNKINKSNNK